MPLFGSSATKRGISGAEILTISEPKGPKCSMQVKQLYKFISPSSRWIAQRSISGLQDRELTRALTDAQLIPKKGRN